MTDLIEVLHRRRWWVGVGMVLAALVGYGVGTQSPVESRAETKLLLVPAEDGVSQRSEQVPLDERQSAVIARAESQPVRTDVIKALSLDPGDIKGISAHAQEGESFVTLEVTTVDGVDTAAITDQVATAVIERQRDAVRERNSTLADQLRQAAGAVDEEVATIDAALAQLSQETAALQLEVDRASGTDAMVDPLAQLTVKNDRADALRGSRAGALTTKADFERRAREADVSALSGSVGVEVDAPAGRASTASTFPALQLAVLGASIVLVAMVCAAYFTAYRTESRRSRYPAFVIDPDWTARAVPPERPPDANGHDNEEITARNAERT